MANPASLQARIPPSRTLAFGYPFSINSAA
jgi:hypothetical protein